MDSACTMDSCTSPTVGRGFCRRHYAAWWKSDGRKIIAAEAASAKCVTCGRPTGRRRFCGNGCESKWHRYGGRPPRGAACEVCGQYIEYGPREDMRAVPVGTRQCPGKHRRQQGYCPTTVDELAARDGATCALCFEPVDMALEWPHRMAATRDHIIPLANGGGNGPENLQLAHFCCNSRKGNRVPANSRAH